MPEYISRDELIGKAISTGLCDNDGNMYGAGDVVLVDDIRAIPAAAVAPVAHGRWIRTEYGTLLYCSVCHGYPSFVPTHCHISQFCPNCGAKMDM